MFLMFWNLFKQAFKLIQILGANLKRTKNRWAK